MMTLDDIRDQISKDRRRIRQLEEENAHLRVRCDELVGEVVDWQNKAEQFKRAWRGEQETSERLRAFLMEERIRANGTS